MNHQEAYKIAEEINKFFELGFDGRKMAQLSQIIINQQSTHFSDGAKCDCGNPMSGNTVMCAECISEKKDALR